MKIELEVVHFCMKLVQLLELKCSGKIKRILRTQSTYLPKEVLYNIFVQSGISLKLIRLDKRYLVCLSVLS
jgi:hypothetical protein